MHSLNIQGIFFQKLIASIIRKHKRIFYVTSEYPVEYPIENTSSKGPESRLDILAQIRPGYQQQSAVHLLIECKKANPEFVDWMFFPKTSIDYHYSNVNYLRRFVARTDNGSMTIKSDVVERHANAYVLADDARETRGSYENISKNIKTKTTNASITDAAYQIVLATHAYATEIRIRLVNAAESNLLSQHLFVPIIVTTANLYMCKFNENDISLATGEIPLQKVTFERVDQLFYEYAIPHHLQIKQDDWWLADKTSDINKYVRRHILVINSDHFNESLNWLESHAEFIIGG